MGYYQNQQYFEELVIEGEFYPGTYSKDTIDMFNNDSIFLKLEGLTVASDDELLVNSQNISILCIIIDWGDGKKDTLSPENFKVTGPAVAYYESWMNKSHEYHFHNGIDKTDLIITIYNTKNEKTVITIPIRIKIKSLAETRAKFELISANITNDNKVSYIINDATTKQMIILNSVQDDWTENKSFLDKKTALYNSLNN